MVQLPVESERKEGDEKERWKEGGAGQGQAWPALQRYAARPGSHG